MLNRRKAQNNEKMKTFIKQIEKACAKYNYYNVIKAMQIKSETENTRVAIVSVKETQDSERHYTIFYRYQTMKKIDYIGYYASIYNQEDELIHNAYMDACEEFAKFAN